MENQSQQTPTKPEQTSPPVDPQPAPTQSENNIPTPTVPPAVDTAQKPDTTDPQVSSQVNEKIDQDKKKPPILIIMVAILLGVSLIIVGFFAFEYLQLQQ
ncbi:hypothetical protein ACFL1P_00740 [Patescibacteria group bacterium]